MSRERLKWYFRRQFGMWVWQIISPTDTHGSCGKSLVIEIVSFINSYYELKTKP